MKIKKTILYYLPIFPIISVPIITLNNNLDSYSLKLNNKIVEQRTSNLEFRKNIQFNLKNWSNNKEFEALVDVFWGNETEWYPSRNSWESIIYEGNISFLNDYFIGNKNNINRLTNKKYFNGTKLLFDGNRNQNAKSFRIHYSDSNKEFENSLFNWNDYNNKAQIFQGVPRSFEFILLNEYENNLLHNDFYCRNWRGADNVEFWSKNFWSYNLNNSIIKIENNFRLKAFESGGADWDSAYIWFKIINDSLNFESNVSLPYSLYDVNLFKNTFENIFTKRIVLKNVKNPIIFDYNENTDNENKVKEIINSRINEFFNDANIINSKLGPISIFDNSKNEYVGNNEAGKVEYYINPAYRGQKGKQTIIIRYQLPHGRRFAYFDGNQDKLEFNLEIVTQNDIQSDNNLDIKITPYKGVSDGYQDNFLLKDYFNCRIGINNPISNEIIWNKTNINEAKYIQNNKNENLIASEKFPVISQAGTIIKLNLAIQLGSPDNIIEEAIEFNRIFTNGKQFVSHIIDENKNIKYKNSNIKIVNNKIDLSLELIDGKINVYSNSKTKLYSINGQKIAKNSCFVDIKSVNVSIPSEQLQSSSQWVQNESAKYFKEKDNNIIEYVGKFKIYDPFFFWMKNELIDTTDPITGMPLKSFSRYKPFIVNDLYDVENLQQKGQASQIYPSSNKNDDISEFNANLGPYIMTNRPIDNGTFNFSIVIKEYDTESKENNFDDRYTKTKWVLNIEMELLNSKSNLEMLGYKDNKIINDINEKKYFNEDDIENYRGNFANRQTGMYIPKIVWVNSYPPESFLFDPRDKNGELIVPINSSPETILNAKYDIGYIAELNGTAFANGDYASNESFGGFEILFDENKFQPNGLMPYIEKYTFNKNSLEPKIEKVSLSASGYQIVDATNDFGQIILKRPNSNTYLYQFYKINTRSEILKYQQDLIGIYGNRYGLEGKPLFIDFWQTFHGNNLKNYLLNKKLIENEEKISELEYSDVIQYWNIYVNDSDNYNGISIGKNSIEKFKPNLGYGLTSSNNKDNLKNDVILQITKLLNNLLYKEGWIDEDLIYEVGFKIEENPNIFESKLDLLLNEFNKSLKDAQVIDFNVIINEDYFANKPIKVNGKNSISILNNKDINKIIDLSKEKGNTLLINSTKSYFNQNNQSKLVSEIECEIIKSLNKDFSRIIKRSKLNISNYVPQLNVDYQLKFKDRWGNLFTSIDNAIKSCLLNGTSSIPFDNDLFIEVKAIFNNQSHFMINSFTKIINNNSNNESVMEIDNFDLSQIVANNLNINTTKDGILNNQTYWNSDDDIELKAKGIWNLIQNRIQNDVNLYSRKWQNAYKKELVYGLNYQIKFIERYDENNNVIYYQTQSETDYLNVIKNALLKDIENEIETFNRKLIIEISSIQSSTFNPYTIGSFTKEINNAYFNNGIEDDNNETNVGIDINNNLIDIKNENGNTNGFNMWWVITSLTIFGLLSIGLIAIIIIRKNRRIR